MGNRKYFLLGMVCSFCNISAQQLQKQDAVSLSLSDADIACGEASLFSNPAQVPHYRQKLLILNYSNPYLLPGLSTSSLAGVWSRRQDTFSGTLGYFGSRILNEILISFSYGREISHWLDAGIRMNYWRRKIEVYDEPQHMLTGEAGIRMNFFRNLQIGMHYINPAGVGYPGTDDFLERNLQLGLGYTCTHDFYLAAKLALIDLRKPALSLGLGYYPIKGMVLRCGLKIGNYLSWSFGLGTTKGRFQVDLGICQHTVLGLSPACTVSYKIAGE